MKQFFDNTIIKYSKVVLILLFLSISFLGYYATKLEIDASADTLLLDDDKDLLLTQEISKRYGGQDFLVLTFSTEEYLLSKKNLDLIRIISEDLKELPRVDSIVSILTVPMLQSPIRDITELVNDIKTIEDEGVDKNLAKQEFLTSPLYKNSLVSSDFKTTAILINLKNIQGSAKFIKEENSKNIAAIRAVMEKYQGDVTLFLGGISMIANDIIAFVKNDLVVYGTALLLILIVVLWVIFKKLIWVLLPIIICVLSVVATSGILGFFGWKVTVISSNFIALQLIITLSLVIHLMVRYIELANKYKNASSYKLVINTVLSKLNPSVFAIVTTVAGFGSLVFSGIKPVINLGWMMSSGILMSLVIAFIIFPAILVNLKPQRTKNKIKSENSSFTANAANLVVSKARYIYAVTIALIVFNFSGAFGLIVENSFINYFKKDTEIYKGMEVIDKHLGGTTPLDVIINFSEEKPEEVVVEVEESFDDFSFEDEFEEAKDDAQYWFTKDKMDLILKVHDYLESLDSVGNVQSLGTLLRVGKILNNNEELNSFKLALFYNNLPQEYKNIILTPYINIEENQARISMRIIDSDPNLRRDDFLSMIKNDLSTMIPNSQATFQVSNLMVLYNNMLQSLFDSQIKTLGVVLLILFVMFMILFRSIKVSFIALITNIIPISLVFGIMGWFEIPLDIMTITIAAISIGIGVDNTIHYIYRYKSEYKLNHDYIIAMKNSHKSIGYAMYYTSLSIILGFSILVLSNLIPTIYFGLLTVVVMIGILTSALFLLPRLLILIKPYGN